MNAGWRYVVTSPARRDLRRLDIAARQRLFAALDRLAETDVGDLRKLGGRENEWRLRVGAYRALFNRDSAARLPVVLHVLPRGRAYRTQGGDE